MSKVASILFICVIAVIGVRNSHGTKTASVDFADSRLIATAFTPFKNDALDVSMVPYIAKRYAKYKIFNIYLTAYYGGGPSMPLKDRKALLDAWHKEAQCYNFRLFVEIGAMAFVEVLEYAEFCSRKNVTALTAFSEIVYQPENPSELIEDMEKICEAAPDISLYYHQLTVVSQELGPVEATLTLLNKVSCYAGSLTSIDPYLKFYASSPLTTGIQFITDTTELIAPGLVLNMDAAASTAVTICPGLCLDTEKAVKAGNLTGAYKLQTQINIVFADICYPNGGVLDDTSRTCFENMKYAYFIKSGIDTGVRYPLEIPNSTAIERMSGTLEEYCY